jgi:hypothetical protein
MFFSEIRCHLRIEPHKFQHTSKRLRQTQPQKLCRCYRLADIIKKYQEFGWFPIRCHILWDEEGKVEVAAHGVLEFPHNKVNIWSVIGAVNDTGIFAKSHRFGDVIKDSSW